MDRVKDLLTADQVRGAGCLHCLSQKVWVHGADASSFFSWQIILSCTKGITVDTLETPHDILLRVLPENLKERCDSV